MLYHPITVLALTIGAIMFFFSLDKSSKKTQNSSENIRALEHEVHQISKEIIELEEKKDLVESEQFREKIIRNELLQQKPGEYVLQVPDIEEIPNKTDCTEKICEKQNENDIKPPFQAWKELLF